MAEIQVPRPEDLKFEPENPQSTQKDPVIAEQVFLAKKQHKEWQKTSKQNRKERKKYAEWLFTFVVMWSVFIFIAVIASGNGDLKFSDTVIVSLITTAIANVISLFIIVTKYLFNPDKST